MKKTKKINFSFKVFKKDKTVQRYDSSSKRRFRNQIRLINWQDKDFGVYQKVNYGQGFYNAGLYNRRLDFLFALDAFADSSITEYLYD